MIKTRSIGRANRLGMVKELFTEATLPALSSALVNRGIDPHAIITIVEMHRHTMANPTPSRFRVLYEVN